MAEPMVASARRGAWRGEAVRLIALALLSLFVLAGTAAVPFHGDEAMQIYMSHDYVAVLIDRDPNYLKVSPPYAIDSDAWLRLINGSVNRYLIGLSWHMAGYTSGDLPPRPGWDWGLSYADGVATGHRPSADFMAVARLSSALLTGASVWLLYAVVRAFGAWPALLAAALYALHPVVLLNGRRAMQEGSLLAFGLLAVAAAVAWALQPDTAPVWRRLAVALLLALASALALASKHSAAVFVAGAFAIVGVDALLRRAGWRRRLETIGLALVSAALALALWVGLSPALWNDPIARLGDLLVERAALLEIQVTVGGGVPLTLAERVSAWVEQPFFAAPQFFELAAWGEDAAVQAEVGAYLASPLSGAASVLVGALMFGLMACGVMAGLVWALRSPASVRARLALGVLAWAALTAASLLLNPLPWQRYYLVLIPPLLVLAGLGAAALAASGPERRA